MRRPANGLWTLWVVNDLVVFMLTSKTYEERRLENVLAVRALTSPGDDSVWV